jgi:hypothetical protein
MRALATNHTQLPTQCSRSHAPNGEFVARSCSQDACQQQLTAAEPAAANSRPPAAAATPDAHTGLAQGFKGQPHSAARTPCT